MSKTLSQLGIVFGIFRGFPTSGTLNGWDPWSKEALSGTQYVFHKCKKYLFSHNSHINASQLLQSYVKIC